MPQIDRSGWVVLTYDGSKAPAEHLRSVFTVKQVAFRSGEAVEVDPRFASVALKSAPEGTLTVVSGLPVDADMKSPAQVKADKARDARVGVGKFGVGAHTVPMPEKASPALIKNKV